MMSTTSLKALETRLSKLESALVKVEGYLTDISNRMDELELRLARSEVGAIRPATVPTAKTKPLKQEILDRLDYTPNGQTAAEMIKLLEISDYPHNPRSVRATMSSLAKKPPYELHYDSSDRKYRLSKYRRKSTP